MITCAPASPAPVTQPPLQPYQGRNPCMERNLMMQSDSCEELGCQGNILVNKSSKHAANDASLYSKLVSSETQSLVPHDYLGQQQQQQQQLHHHHHQPQQQQQHLHHVAASQQLSLRPVTPIPYVQVSIERFEFLVAVWFIVL